MYDPLPVFDKDENPIDELSIHVKTGDVVEINFFIDKYDFVESVSKNRIASKFLCISYLVFSHFFCLDIRLQMISVRIIETSPVGSVDLIEDSPSTNDFVTNFGIKY